MTTILPQETRSTAATSEQPMVTIVVVPRERFSYSKQSLESIYAETDYPFELVYVDGGSSPELKAYLEAQSREKQFKLIRTESYLSPNRARNIGIQAAKGKYIVFVDNDVLVQRGWLQKLVDCAEETGATVVGTLTCIDKPLHEVVHNGGGTTYIEVRTEGNKTGRYAVQKSYLEGKRVSKIPEQLSRVQCDFVEFHTALVRKSFFDDHGLLDEGLLSTREHIDLCLSAAKVGGTVYCERQSIVTYMTGAEFDWYDYTYFSLRWSDAWDLASFDHFRKKWNLEEDWYFERRYNRLGRRRYRALMRPIISRFPLKEKRNDFADWLQFIERPINNFISDRYARKHEYAKHSLGLRRSQRLKNGMKFEKPENTVDSSTMESASN
ncbi:glycosyltransferase family 2 protein [Altericista sp. CCNU0014]|uniref:glycosyltransferase family 2 protein n=1 Tax=Altericista sp. CCNU0014 TaxID=3082949 RepID=UPI00384A5320